MNINQSLLEGIKRHLNNYSIPSSKMEEFLLWSGDFESRQELSISIIEKLMTQHGKESLLMHMVELARVEMGIRELEPWARDHVVHALLCFALGIYIQKVQFAPINGIEIDPFQWKLACLFHDVGYPLQLARELMTPFSEKINEIRDELEVDAPSVVVEIIPRNLEILGNNKNSLDLIQRRLDSWDLQVNVVDEFRSRIETGEVCHGMVSALAVLKIIDFMYERYNPNRSYTEVFSSDDINWDQNFFEIDVVSACSAIFIHNLPVSTFTHAKIAKNKSPLAFLLKLTDILQEWERPSKALPTGHSASQFDISMIGQLVEIRADIPRERKEQLTLELNETLDSPDVIIV